MPTIFTHGVVGLTSGAAVYKKGMGIRFWLLSLICTIIPDADVICFKIGIPYGHFLGHRGFFHSIFFAFIFGFLMVFLYLYKREKSIKDFIVFGLFFSFLYASHCILDAFTNGGLGIALLSPFDNTRYFFEFTPIQVSPINPKVFFSGRALSILKNEILWVWVPFISTMIFIRLTMFMKRVLKEKYIDNGIEDNL